MKVEKETITMRHSHKHILPIILLAIGLTGCFKHTQYHSYQALGEEGWTRNHYITFTTDSVKSDMHCHISIELRNDSKYKYQDLWLVIANDIDSTNQYQYDTLHCYLTDKEGHFTGSGIGTLHESKFNYKDADFRAGTKPRILIKHIMRDGHLYGISDIGVKIERYGLHQSLEK